MSNEIREMFGAIALRYDRANEVLSFGVHRRWRRRAVRLSGAASGMSVCDCATGTGDLAMAFQRTVGPNGTVVGVDFADTMILEARRKAAKAGLAIDYRVADVLALPFDDHSFDIASIAFGIRNVDDPLLGVKEMARIVRPGGRVLVLEFGQPDAALFGRVYRWYSRRVIPAVGRLITGRAAAYCYLAESASRFPAGEAFGALMRMTGVFREVRIVPLSMKIAYVYVGTVDKSTGS